MSIYFFGKNNDASTTTNRTQTGSSSYDDAIAQLGASDLQTAIEAIDTRLDTSLRPSLTANLSFYVDPILGNDSNLGTETNCFKTIAKCLNLVEKYNLNNFTITFNLKPGTYKENIVLTKSIVSFGKIIFKNYQPNATVVFEPVSTTGSQFFFRLTSFKTDSYSFEKIIFDSQVNLSLCENFTFTDCKFRNNYSTKSRWLNCNRSINIYINNFECSTIPSTVLGTGVISVEDYSSLILSGSVNLNSTATATAFLVAKFYSTIRCYAVFQGAIAFGRGFIIESFSRLDNGEISASNTYDPTFIPAALPGISQFGSTFNTELSFYETATFPYTQRFGESFIPSSTSPISANWILSKGNGQIIDSRTFKNPNLNTIYLANDLISVKPSILNGTTTSCFVFLLAGSTPTPSYQATYFTSDDLNTRLFVGELYSANGTTINQTKTLFLRNDDETKDLIDKGAINLESKYPNPIINTMRLAGVAGRFKFAGRGVSAALPHTVTTGGLNPISYTLYTPLGTVVSTGNQDFNFNRYWNGTAIATPVNSTFATCQFLYLKYDGTYHLVLGEYQYSTLSWAIASADTAEAKRLPAVLNNSDTIYLCAIAGLANATNIAANNPESGQVAIMPARLR